ncbi:Farnesyl pyrophosphate synthase, partial [Frankliniella fusca]
TLTPLFDMLRTASALRQGLRPALGSALDAAGPKPRHLSLLAPSPLRMQQLDDIKALNDFFPTVVEQLLEESKVCNIPSETEWLAKLLNHTVPGGKMVRALATYNGMRELGPSPSQQSDEFIAKAKCLAWSVEMIQSSMALADDIADQAPQRRGKPSWYTIAGSGAVFDALLLEHCSYRLLKRHFTEDAYFYTIELFVNTVFRLCIGQNHDIHCLAAGKPKFDDFSLERYRALCEFKSGEYSFYLPTAAAMFANGLTDPLAHKAARDIASDLGYIYQIQDDYLDCYGIIEHMGKQRTDIRNGKCTWLVAEAKRRATPKLLKTLKENYGMDDDAKVAIVEQVYEDLSMKQVFLDFEAKSFKDITNKIDKYSKVLPRVLYTYVLESVKYHVNR